ncbi:glycosyltransferase family A protein [Microbacterium sp. NPDC056569]|uniref:glycosyltransferase family A protein n=1 Tax=Microbacterium sp. NPDC056569 TaxID=3345867 RepID=UPI00366F9A32
MSAPSPCRPQSKVSAPSDEATEQRPRPSVTVVVPVRDDAALLRRCLEALRLQTWHPDEVIVVDDGSVDASAAVAAELGATVARQPPRGIATAGAAGYDMAKGELIARLDADSLPPHDWLERLLAPFDRDPSVAAVAGDAWFVDAAGKPRPRAAAAYLGAYRAVLLPTLGHTPLFGSNMAMRRDAWSQVAAEVHRDDDLLHDDLDLSFHLGRTHRIRRARGAAVGISARPLRLDAALLLRIRRGFHTVLIHWPRDFPPWRWWMRARALRTVAPERAR